MPLEKKKLLRRFKIRCVRNRKIVLIACSQFIAAVEKDNRLDAVNAHITAKKYSEVTEITARLVAIASIPKRHNSI